jgi:general secretion pathway protein K
MGVVAMSSLPSTRRQRGFALIVVLWVVMLLSIVAAIFLRDSRSETRIAHNLLENAKAEAIADAGVQRAMLGLLDQDETTVWHADGRPYAFSLADGVARIRIQSELGKIDLNASPDEVVKGLFMAAGVDEVEAGQLVDALADFRDPDDLPRRAGAERADYEAMGLLRGPKNAPLETIEELIQVRGVTPALFDRISSIITVYGRNPVDVTTAPQTVLQVLRTVMPERLDRMIAARQARPARVSRPRIVTVIVEARTQGGGLFVREAVIERRPNAEPFRILAWRQRWQEAKF